MKTHGRQVELASQQASATVEQRTGSVARELGRDVPVLVKLDSSKPFYLEPGFFSAIGAVLSLLAIGLSIFNTVSASRKESIARRQSINDEFWLRKVLFPTAIEPILKFFADTIQTLPADRSDPFSTSDSIAKFKSKFDSEYTDLSTKLLSVAILKQDLYTAIADEFEQVQDRVTAYCYANREGHTGGEEEVHDTKAALSSKLSEHQLIILQRIKQVQEEIK